jgi:hypothetical protein
LSATILIQNDYLRIERLNIKEEAKAAVSHDAQLEDNVSAVTR